MTCRSNARAISPAEARPSKATTTIMRRPATGPALWRRPCRVGGLVGLRVTISAATGCLAGADLACPACHAPRRRYDAARRR
ncbi:MAG: hypothetical protein WDW38_003011 [Sanguina aurantia]